jgi:hypothetical protein
MNPTHDQTRTTAGAQATGWNIFRAWITTGTHPADQPDTDTTAPVDEHGYVLTDAAHVALATSGNDHAPSTSARVLRSAALYLERHGWIQGAYYDATARTFTPAACMVGAIGVVCYGRPVDAPAQMFDDPGYLDFEEAVLHLDRYLLVEDGRESYEFNDAHGRHADDVLHVLRRAADTPADELIDAIRAIDTRNAEVAALADLLTPGGIWGEPTPDASVSGCQHCGAGCPGNDYNGYADPGAFGPCGCHCHASTPAGGDGE